MRRWIALVLIALLPLQISWSLAAEYGDHGATLAAPHADLHDQGHAHDRSAADVPAADEADAHTVCCDLHQCHGHGSFAALTATAGVGALATATGYAVEQAPRFREREGTRIERPQWAASPIPC